MAKIEDLTLVGESGTQYTFAVYAMGTQFKALGAVYAVTRRVEQGTSANHTPVYVGQTDDLSTRFENHHKRNCFDRQRANCVCVHLEPDDETRLAKETDLLAAYEWPCND